MKIEDLSSGTYKILSVANVQVFENNRPMYIEYHTRFYKLKIPYAKIKCVNTCSIHIVDISCIVNKLTENQCIKAKNIVKIDNKSVYLC